MDDKSLVIRFWEEHGREMLLHLICEDMRIYGYEEILSGPTPVPSRLHAEEGIVFVYSVYKKRGKDGTKEKWLEKPLNEKKILLGECKWVFRPIKIKPSPKYPFEPKKAEFVYLMKRTEYGPQMEVEKNLICTIKTLLDGTLEIDDDSLKIEEDITETRKRESRYNFKFPKRFMAKMNYCLLKNFLPYLWQGKRLAFWSRTDENISFYMGFYDVAIDENFEYLEHLRNICGTTAGAVLVAYTCFSLLCPFFSSYHRFTKQSSYIKVKKGIQNLIAVNVQGTKPEYAKELVNCCCNYFDIFEGTIIDGISVQKESINRLRLDIDEFEKTILQTACVLWVNRIPIEELETKGRLINLKIDFSPVEKGFINISAYIVKNLAVSFFEKTVCALDNEEGFKNLNTKNKRNIINFIERVETLAKEHSISIKNMDSEKTRCRIQRFNYGNSSVRYLTSFMSRFKFYREDFYQINPQLNVYEKKKRKEFEKSIHELYLDTISRLKKENDKVALFYPLEYTRKRAVENLHRDAKARNIDKSAIKKLSYLLASFKVFASLCLPVNANLKL